jgi:hypothetical protein
MFFRLLHGIHTEKGTKYEAKTERNAEGVLVYVSQPIVESKNDLVAHFGTNKFQRMSDKEASLLLAEHRQAAGEEMGTPFVPPAAPATPESEVSKAAKEGTKEIAKPFGKDVTHKFPFVQKKTDLTVRFKRGEGYFVEDDGKIVTEVPLKREEVLAWVRAYKEEN